MKNLLRSTALLMMLVSASFIYSCKDDEGTAAKTVVAGFTFEVDATDPLTVNFTNTSTDFKDLSWNFGDGSPLSTEASPSHTFAAGGDYAVSLTATDKNGTDSDIDTKTITIVGGVTPGPFDADRLVGGAWKVRKADASVFVGPGLNNSEWYIVPLAFLNGADADPVNDWSCMMDDEFIFTGGGDNSAGSMEYKTNGTARNDATYMGPTNGCFDDAQIAASGNGAAFGSGIHSYEYISETVSPSGNPVIKLTNGATGAAFIGFFKGYYGGENSNAANLPNGGSATTQYEVMDYQVTGGKEILTLSVDISPLHDASVSWTMVMIR